MGTPDEKFPFPIGALKGIRVAVPEPQKALRGDNASDVIKPEGDLKFVKF